MGRFPRLLSVVSALALAACGSVGPRVIPPFETQVIGAAGGNMQVETVALVLPPGALTQDTVVSILPQPNPLPLDPLAPPITLMPGLMCIGPVGTLLVNPAHVQFCYDPATIPPGSTEADVVLLEWDDAAQFLRVVAGATHNTTTHCFDHIAYGELGHIGVGALGALTRNLVFASTAPPMLMGSTLSVLPFGDGLVLASSTGLALPETLDGSSGAEGYVASPDGANVLWRLNNSQQETRELHSSDTTTEVTSLCVPGDVAFLANDPMYGFLSAARAYYARPAFLDDTSHDTVFDVGVTGVPAGAELYFDEESADGDLVDVRVSPDETMVLLRYRSFFFGDLEGALFGSFDSLFVIDAVTGAEIGTFLPGLNDVSDVTPRWFADSGGLYFVDSSRQTVSACQPDGTSLGVIYTMPALANSYIQDFAVAPAVAWGVQPNTPCAYIRGTTSILIDGVQTAGVDLPTDHSFFVRDVLAGGSLIALDLGARVTVNELIYHPNGTKVIADMVAQSDIVFQTQGPPLDVETVQIFDATTAAQLHVFLTTLEYFDLERTSGELVVWFPNGGTDPNFPLAGLYRLAQNGDTLGTIDTNGLIPTGPARFLLSWRRTPGHFASYIR